MEPGIDCSPESIKAFLDDQYGLVVHEIKQFSQGVLNTNLLCDTGIQKYVFRIYNFKKPEAVQYEVDILEFLKDKQFSSPKLQKTKDNGLIVLFQGKASVVYRYIDGSFARRITIELLEEIGQIMGRLHTLSGGFEPSVQKATWEPEEIKRLVCEEGFQLINCGFPKAEQLLEFLELELDKFSFPDTLPKAITHQDIKPENIIINDKGIQGIIDFDNAYVGTLLHDITTTVIWTCFEKKRLQKSYLNAFLSGYSRIRSLKFEEKEYLYKGIGFRLLREIFIGPFVTQHLPDISKQRSDYFLQLYCHMDVMN